MLTIDILISVKDKKIVRIKEALPEAQEGVKYIICFQYTDEKYLKLIPEELKGYDDVKLVLKNETGLSRSRNQLLEMATGDLVYFIDDDTVILHGALDCIRQTFENNDMDIALFQSQSYSGKLLRDYSQKEKNIIRFRDRFKVLTYEMVCRREKIQGVI